MTDGLWSAFAETGEPLCYLMMKAAERESEKKRTGAADKPRCDKAGDAAPRA